MASAGTATPHEGAKTAEKKGSDDGTDGASAAGTDAAAGEQQPAASVEPRADANGNTSSGSSSSNAGSNASTATSQPDAPSSAPVASTSSTTTATTATTTTTTATATATATEADVGGAKAAEGVKQKGSAAENGASESSSASSGPPASVYTLPAVTRRVAYFHCDDSETFDVGNGLVRPHRYAMTHELLRTTHILDWLMRLRPRYLSQESLCRFHHDSYIEALDKLSRRDTAPHNRLARQAPEDPSVERICRRFNLTGPSAPFLGVLDLARIYASGSVGAAEVLCSNMADIAINWSGGFHHARPGSASRGCYVNDCVLAILTLLTKFQRVLYINLGYDHADAVEQAFYESSKVQTLSFHIQDDLVLEGSLPSTGLMQDWGTGQGTSHSVNVPLKRGLDDESLRHVFVSLFDHAVGFFRPHAIVVQCSAGSVAGDRSNNWNLSSRALPECLKHVRRLGLPMLVLGGCSGRHMANAARTWTACTAALVGIPDNQYPSKVPEHRYSPAYAPTNSMHVEARNMENHNDEEYLRQLVNMSRNIMAMRRG